jgi:hypothetical protein
VSRTQTQSLLVHFISSPEAEIEQSARSAAQLAANSDERHMVSLTPGGSEFDPTTIVLAFKYRQRPVTT